MHHNSSTNFALEGEVWSLQFSVRSSTWSCWHIVILLYLTHVGFDRDFDTPSNMLFLAHLCVGNLWHEDLWSRVLKGCRLKMWKWNSMYAVLYASNTETNSCRDTTHIVVPKVLIFSIEVDQLDRLRGERNVNRKSYSLAAYEKHLGSCCK